jgi:hypothetical protein
MALHPVAVSFVWLLDGNSPEPKWRSNIFTLQQWQEKCERALKMKLLKHRDVTLAAWLHYRKLSELHKYVAFHVHYPASIRLMCETGMNAYYAMLDTERVKIYVR